jgi:hypothetical protein
MEKILTIDGQDVRFKATAALPLHFATHFGSDVLNDALKLGDDQGANTVLMYRMVWTMAYCADNTIKPMEQWFDEFNSFPIYKIFGELNTMFWDSVRGIALKN